MPSIHQVMVERLSSGLRPVRAPYAIKVQWLLWLSSALVLGLLFFTKMPLRDDLKESLTTPAFDVMILFIFAAAALSGWGTIEASIPGEENKGKWKQKTAATLWGSAALIFLLFMPCNADNYLEHKTFMPCLLTVLVIGTVYWFLLSLIIRRNAPLNSRRMGVWTGLSAFLFGLGIITLHCGSQNLYHVLFEHFLPVLAFSWLMGWLGARWLSGWKRKPIS